MSFGGGGSGSGSLQSSTDVTLSNPSDSQVLTYSSSLGKWQNRNSLAPSYATLPAGVTITVQRDGGGNWPARPTSRSDIIVQWKGPDPSPAIVSSGTGGMLNNVDLRFVTP